MSLLLVIVLLVSSISTFDAQLVCEVSETREVITQWKRPVDVDLPPRYGPGVLFPYSDASAPPTPQPCIPSTDVEMIGDFGDHTPTENVVSIVKQSSDASTVQYQVNQVFKNTAIDYLGTEYKGTDGLTVCYHEESANAGPLKENMTAQCEGGYAEVKVYVLDESFIPMVGFQGTGGLSSGTPGDIVRTRGAVGGVRKLSVDECAVDDDALVASFRLPCSSSCGVVTLSADVAPTGAPTSESPSSRPSSEPTDTPSASPTTSQSLSPSSIPSLVPSLSPSEEPSSSPSTMAPSGVPSIIPSSVPSASPSASPSSEPSASPTICIPEFEAVAESDFGPFTPHDEIIQILQQSSNGKTVVFQVHQEFKLLGLGMIAAEYESEDGLVCYSEENVISGPLKSYQTAICVDGIATVSILAKDDCFLPVEFVPPEELLPLSGNSTVDEDTTLVVHDCPLPELLNKTASAPDAMPIEILSYDESKVLFKVSQVWKDSAPLSSLWVRRYTGPGTLACDSAGDIEPAYANTYTATCNEVGFAEVDVFAEDQSFSDTGIVLPPSCNAQGTQSGKKAFGYRFKVPCQCAEMNSARRLAQTTGACIADGATVKAIYKIPCSPGCGEKPINLGLPTQSPTEAPTQAPTYSPTTGPTIPPPTISPTARPTVETPWSKGECPYITLDFNGTTNGQYITDDFMDEYGISISARGPDDRTDAYTPDGAARIFDTSDPVRDSSLGSPNQDCYINPGPGTGNAGKPGQKFENCEPMGKALIIQEGRWNRQQEDYPDDYGYGGFITFSFIRPMYVKKLTVMDTRWPKLKLTLADGIVRTITGDNSGGNGVEEIVVDVDDVMELEVEFDRDGAIAQLDYIPCNKEVASASEMPTCNKTMTSLDFNDASIFSEGDYVTDQMHQEYGVTIQAFSPVTWTGYTPDGAGRIYDTSGGYDKQLNSPNKNCPDGGSGVGDGGTPDSMYANCEPLGNVLILQRDNSNTRRASDRGAIFIFTFDEPTFVNDIGILNIEDGNEVEVWASRFDGTRIPFRATVTGDNGLYPLVISTANVIELMVLYTKRSAITHINYVPCASGDAVGWERPDAEALMWAKYTSPWVKGEECPYIVLDFNKNVENGQFVKEDFAEEFGVLVAAEGNLGGFTPHGAARIFDTSDPKGDRELGTPNESCGGPGRGNRGQLGNEYENCKAYGNALIIQESKQNDMSIPNDYQFGGTITFNFIVPVHLKQIIMIDAKFPLFKMKLSDGSVLEREGRNGDSGGVQKVVLDVEDVKQVEVVIATSGAVLQMDYIPCEFNEAELLLEIPECDSKIIDFNDDGINPGDYITDQFREKYSVDISADTRWWGGYTPDQAARVFDTSNAHGGDRELGAPNEKCSGGGRGRGTGGEPGSPYANCKDIGNALIVQEGRRDTPDAANSGGFIYFKFRRPTFVDYVTFLNGESRVEIFALLYDGSEIPFRVGKTGENALFTKKIMLANVVQIKIDFTGKLAITDMKYGPCPVGSGAGGWKAATCAPTPSPQGIYPSPWPPGECPYVSLDFNNTSEGEYVTDDFAEQYGVLIRAKGNKGGWTPGNGARLIDTSTARWDKSLGTPNSGCGGVGNGREGDRGRKYENCEPLGNALIINGYHSDSSRVFDNRHGGWITFDFVVPVYLKRVITINTEHPRYTLKLKDGTVVKMDGERVRTNGVDHMPINVDDVLQLEVFLSSEGAIAQLDYIPCGEGEYDLMVACPEQCGLSLLDFNVEGISDGDYITDQFKEEHGITINAYDTNGNAEVPNFAARILNTASPSRWDDALGSPNENCPGGGPGEGEGGAPDSMYPNCEPIGNALIIQRKGRSETACNDRGGNIVFRFDKPAYISSLSLMDIDGDGAVIWAFQYDDIRVPIRTIVTGTNGVATVTINTLNVVKLVVELRERAAITDLQYSLCPVGDAVNWKPKQGMMG